MDETKLKIENLDAKISLQVIPNLKELIRRSNYNYVLLWVLILLVCTMAVVSITLVGFMYEIN